jgi:2-keto-4-pentenoate hydratase
MLRAIRVDGAGMETVVQTMLGSFLGETVGPLDGVGVLSLQDAQGVQLAVLDALLARGERVAGWKVGLTSGSSRDAFGVGVRPAGFILQSRVLRSGDCVPWRGIRQCGIESELCFVLGRRLAGAATAPADARAAVAGVAPAFEINETRLPIAAGAALRIADDLSQWGLVVGDVVAPLPESLDLDALEVVLHRDGREMERRCARGHIDDHFESIARLARELALFGRELRPGDRVITGAFTRQAVTAPARFEARFAGLGVVSVVFE